MLSLITSLLRPYRGTLVAILLAMLVETAMSVAAPWPLKIVLDNVVGSHKLPQWHHLEPILSGTGKMQIAAAAAIAAVLIALLARLLLTSRTTTRPVWGSMWPMICVYRLTTICSSYRFATTIRTRPGRC